MCPDRMEGDTGEAPKFRDRSEEGAADLPSGKTLRAKTKEAVFAPNESRDFADQLGTERPGGGVADDDLEREVAFTLHRHPEIDTTRVTVHVRKGEAVVEGAVDSEEERLELLDLLGGITGVRAVNSIVEVRR